MRVDIVWTLFISEMVIYIGNAKQFPRLLPGYRRIIDGRLTTARDHPYMAALLTSSQLITPAGQLHYRCSGSIITEKAILSVAHCFFAASGEPTAANDWKARVGSSFSHLGGIVHEIELIYHKNYDNETRKNDVAVVETVGRIQFSSALVKPIALADRSHSIDDQESIGVVGWGKTAYHAEASPSLHEVSMEVMSNELCNEVYEHLLGTPEAHEYFELGPGEQVFRPITEGMMCAHSKGGRGVCMGDSGGAVVHKGALVAMVALVPAACNSSLPAVFTRVSFHEPWIRTIIRSMNLPMPLDAATQNVQLHEDQNIENSTLVSLS